MIAALGRGVRRARQRAARIGVRLAASALLLVCVPVGGVLYLGAYERHLLDAQERGMVQQGRLLAAALGGDDAGPNQAARAQALLARLDGRVAARLRVLDRRGRVIADSSLFDGAAASTDGTPDPYGRSSASSSSGARSSGDIASARDQLLYRLGLVAVRVKRLFWPRPRTASPAGPSFADAADLVRLPEVQDALAGRYGAATRLTGSQRSVTLTSAIPIRAGTRAVGAGGTASDVGGSAGSGGSSRGEAGSGSVSVGGAGVGGGAGGGEVAGVVLVSQSTHRLLVALYDVRLQVFTVVLLNSLFVAVVLSVFLTASIAHPLRTLSRDASALLDRKRGSAAAPRQFAAAARHDEVGDLARVLETVIARFDAHIQFVESFSADVAHELKNPIAAIRTVAEMLASVDDPGERARFLAMLARDVDRLDRLVSGLREVVHVDAQLDREPTEPVDIGTLLANIAEARRLDARTDGGPARVRVELIGQEAAAAASAAPLVRAAPDRLAQVFDNLVENAVSFSPPGGTVTLTCDREPDGFVRVRVEDDGGGIPEAHLARIFDRFFTYRPTASAAGVTKRHHTGLGLAIARAIVTGYGGTMAASNRPAPRHGARFDVRLPLI